MTALLERPLVWDKRSSHGDFFLRCYSGDTLVAQGELLPDSIGGCPGIWGIFVDEAHRGQGHAREIMRRLIKRAVKRGYANVWLIVEADNVPALALYESLGFTEDYRTEDRIGTWGVHLKAQITMRLVLTKETT